MGLRRGEAVEVCSDEEGFKGAWYPATVIRKRGLKYLIEYKDVVTDDGKSKLREQVEADQIRPVPPILSLNRQCFIPREIVDAHDKDGWWIGSIENVLADNNYVVHFSHSGEKLESNVSHLRLHLDWVDGKWLQPSEPFENTNSISPKPNRGNSRPNKFKREARVLEDGKGDSLCASLTNAEGQANEKSGKRRKTSKSKEKEEGGKKHSSALALHANITKETEVPFLEARVEEVQNILHARGGVTGETQRSLDSNIVIAMNSPYPGTTCETGAKASLKQMEVLAYHSVLKALYLQGAHNLKIELLLAELREVLHVSNEESASELRRITYALNN